MKIRPVKLPFLNVELPLVAFFFIAPFVILIMHAYALMLLLCSAKRPRVFTMSCGATPESDNKEIRDKLRRLLPSNIFLQILAGPPELGTGVFGFFL
jgi:hypothetical protein